MSRAIEVDEKVVKKTMSCRLCAGGSAALSSSSSHERSEEAVLGAIRLQFSLPAGSYATVFLRELLSCDDMLL